jgi:hypothetical protein
MSVLDGLELITILRLVLRNIAQNLLYSFDKVA